MVLTVLDLGWLGLIFTINKAPDRMKSYCDLTSLGSALPIS
jgi:hypothetical protein